MSGRKGVELQESEQYVMRARGTTLTIRNIKQDDGGSYTCKASNKAGDVQREIFLKVFGKNLFPHLHNLCICLWSLLLKYNLSI